MFARAVPSADIPIRFLVHILLSVAAGVLVLAACLPPARAEGTHTIVVPADDGYDFGDCLRGGKPCGQVVADAYCQANGLTKSTAYGPMDDITGSIGSTSTTKPEPGSFLVTCKG